jgi:hypothetical protein
MKLTFSRFAFFLVLILSTLAQAKVSPTLVGKFEKRSSLGKLICNASVECSYNWFFQDICSIRIEDNDGSSRVPGYQYLSSLEKVIENRHNRLVTYGTHNRWYLPRETYSSIVKNNDQSYDIFVRQNTGYVGEENKIISCSGAARINL